MISPIFGFNMKQKTNQDKLLYKILIAAVTIDILLTFLFYLLITYII